ncbi:MAG: thioredoxin domain-containing protein [Anaerolineales bacterium]|nr:thioredoxin domain-containing protein [Anaerolineales bacterium]
MNRLASATSPYLLQHADNPVDWYPWGPEALALARREDRPIFLSIGYAACHWCHVMAHESFTDPQTAALMNTHFVNIKVDREERPDLDSIYMSATTAMTGSGGWPMSVFLTPDLQPFFAGTYFPPAARHHLPAFSDVLASLAQAWQEQRNEILRIGTQVQGHLQAQAGGRRDAASLTPEDLEQAAARLAESHDRIHGGWGPAPKFPQPMAIEFLLQRHLAGDQRSLQPAQQALQAMARGGMYDVVGGGFARYSTDERWLVPHFEKMLPDQALLARVYLHAWQVTGQPFYQRIVTETLAFVQREMTGSHGGFHSSLDADSAGEEGRFYVWTAGELQEALGTDYPLFQAAYTITPAGNWEGRIVLQRGLDDASLAARFALHPDLVIERLAGCHARLLAVRSERVRPGSDDKVLTGWNGLMLATFAEAASALNDPEYLSTARRCADFLLTALRPGGQLRRAWRDGQATAEVFLEDYSALIAGLLALYQADFNPHWFSTALELSEEMIVRFADENGGFFDAPADGEPLLIRPKDLQDNALPSGNALAAEVLLRLAAYTGREDLRSRAEAALRLVAPAAAGYPAAFARWLSAAGLALGEIDQVAVIGDPTDPATQALLAVIRECYRPNIALAASGLPLVAGSPALLHDRPLKDGRPTVHVCQEFVCRKPVTTVGELRSMLAS